MNTVPDSATNGYEYADLTSRKNAGRVEDLLGLEFYYSISGYIVK